MNDRFDGIARFLADYTDHDDVVIHDDGASMDAVTISPVAYSVAPPLACALATGASALDS